MGLRVQIFLPWIPKPAASLESTVFLSFIFLRGKVGEGRGGGGRYSKLLNPFETLLIGE